MFLAKVRNQRTNGPVNAHLMSGPTVSTKTNFANFDIVLKWVKVNSVPVHCFSITIIIYINYVELENILLHAK